MGRRALVVAVLLLAACGGNGGGGAEEAEDPAALFALRPVLDASEPPCEEASDEGVEVLAEVSEGRTVACLTVGMAIADTSDVRTASLGVLPSGRRSVSVVLGRRGAANLDQHAARRLGDRLAIVVHGRVVKAPVITLPTFAGRVEVVGLPDAEAEELFRELKAG